MEIRSLVDTDTSKSRAVFVIDCVLQSALLAIGMDLVGREKGEERLAANTKSRCYSWSANINKKWSETENGFKLHIYI